MAFNIEDLGDIDAIIGQWCLEKVPPHLKKQIDHDYEIDGQSVTICEVRPLFMGKPGQVTRRAFAKFRYVKSSELWIEYVFGMTSVVGLPVLAEATSPTTPEQQKLATLRATNERAAVALDAERKRQQAAREQKAMAAAGRPPKPATPGMQ